MAADGSNLERGFGAAHRGASMNVRRQLMWAMAGAAITGACASEDPSSSSSVGGNRKDAGDVRGSGDSGGSTGPSPQPPDTNSIVDSGSNTTDSGMRPPAQEPGPPDANTASRCPAGPFEALVLSKTLPTVIPLPTQVEFLEGPVWMSRGGYLLFSAWNFSDPTGGLGPQSTIYKFSPPSTFSVFRDKGNVRSNGLAFDASGDVIVAAHDKQEIARINLLSGARTTIAGQFNGKAFNSPNDVAVRTDGSIYFTDPDYQLDGRLGQGGVKGAYRIAKGGTVTLIDGTRNQPNGITLSPDETFLYIGGGDGAVKRYPVAADGSVGAGADFIANAGGGTDGMGVDCAGNLYVSVHANKEVKVYDRAAKFIGSIPTQDNVTNIAFGGVDQKTVYITTAGKLLSFAVNIPGLPY
jgi:gluconolactonase